MVEPPVPSPANGQVLIRVAACGMGYVDALVATGGYQVKPPVPFTPGHEISGVVERVGASVDNVRSGDRVMAYSFGGGLAEYVAVPAEMVERIPDCMTLPQAAVFRINYLTALHGLADRAQLRAGERMLVFGAAGGVGTAAVQIGRILGAEIVAAASTEEKRAFAKAQGAQQVIDTEPDGWRDRLKALCGGSGPTVVFDPVCGPLFEAAFRSQAWGGRHLVIGFAGGPIPKLSVNLALMKGSALVGVDVRQLQELEPVRTRDHVDRLLQWVGEGRLCPPVGKTFAFEDYAAAMTNGISGSGPGKAIVRISEDA
ncbi:zinc-binding dehydrogenase [Novosphingobium sp. Gsoil 351]|nr:zinc-binding dehydrogenase [Novosphingobium sp. Gsoil 351]